MTQNQVRRIKNKKALILNERPMSAAITPGLLFDAQSSTAYF